MAIYLSAGKYHNSCYRSLTRESPCHISVSCLSINVNQNILKTCYTKMRYLSIFYRDKLTHAKYLLYWTMLALTGTLLQLTLQWILHYIAAIEIDYVLDGWQHTRI